MNPEQRTLKSVTFFPGFNSLVVVVEGPRQRGPPRCRPASDHPHPPTPAARSRAVPHRHGPAGILQARRGSMAATSSGAERATARPPQPRARAPAPRVWQNKRAPAPSPQPSPCAATPGHRPSKGTSPAGPPGARRTLYLFRVLIRQYTQHSVVVHCSLYCTLVLWSKTPPLPPG